MPAPDLLLQRVSQAMEQRNFSAALEDLLSYRQQERPGVPYGIVLVGQRIGYLHVYAGSADERRILEQNLLTTLIEEDLSGQADLHHLELPIDSGQTTCCVSEASPLPLLQGPYLCGFLFVKPDEKERLWAASISLLSHHFQLLEQAAATDYLTGLANRSTFDEFLQKSLELHQRHSIPFTIGMLDINDFKQINDQSGHAEGDRVMKTVGRTLSHLVRQTDLVARYGGDEFAVILMHTDPDQARQTVKRIDHDLHKRLKGKVSLAGGWVHLQGNITPGAEDLLHLADQALYQNKRNKSGEWELQSFDAPGSGGPSTNIN